MPQALYPSLCRFQADASPRKLLLQWKTSTVLYIPTDSINFSSSWYSTVRRDNFKGRPGLPYALFYFLTVSLSRGIQSHLQETQHMSYFDAKKPGQFPLEASQWGLPLRGRGLGAP